MRTPGPLLLAGAAALLGCGETTETSPEGRILVTVSSHGGYPQSDKYIVTLNGERPLAITPNGSAVYDEVPEGTYVVHLFMLADNCAVSGSPNHRFVRLEKGDVVEITFSVLCSAAVTGGFRIVVSTGGTPRDEDGYQLTVERVPHRMIGVDAEEVYEGLAPGVRLVTLKNVARFCKVVGGNPQPHIVVVGQTVRVAIRVTCGIGGPPLLKVSP